MEVINIHRRIINQPKETITPLLGTLASDKDQMLAIDKWPAMFLDRGLKVGSKGGHGTIRYTVIKYIPGECICFRFTRPKGFNGIHEFKISELTADQSEIKHEIHMKISGWAMVTWPLAIRWLHDAYIEDAFDRVENHFSSENKVSNWSYWVQFLRGLFKLMHKKNTLLTGAF